MGHLLSIPHRRARGMCPVNGVRDRVHWRSDRGWSKLNEFIHPSMNSQSRQLEHNSHIFPIEILFLI